MLVNDDGNMLWTIEAKLTKWKNYIEDLFHDNSSSVQWIETAENEPRITNEEISYALKITKNGKSADPDELPIELWTNDEHTYSYKAF